MQVNLVDYFQSRLMQVMQQRSAEEARIKSVEGTKADQLQKAESLKSQIAAKIRFRTTAIEEGVDVSTLNAKIHDLELQLATTRQRLQDLPEPAPSGDFSSQLGSATLDVEIAKVIATLGVNEATIIEKSDDCVQLLELELPWPEQVRKLSSSNQRSSDKRRITGEINHIMIQCGPSLPRNSYSHRGEEVGHAGVIECESEVFLAVNTGRFHPYIAPDEVRCVKAYIEAMEKQDLQNRARSKPLRVAIMKSTSQIVASWDCDRIQHALLEANHGRRTVESNAIAQRVVPVSQILRDEVTAVGGKVSFASRPLTPMLGYIYDWLVANSLEQPCFQACSEKLASDQIADAVEHHWRAFVSAPWSSEIDGPLAKLKYLLENNEIPRLWNGEYSGVYGLRLRTRDHTWLICEFAIVSLPSCDKANQANIKVVSESPYYVAQAGKLLMLVYEDEE